MTNIGACAKRVTMFLKKAEWYQNSKTAMAVRPEGKCEKSSFLDVRNQRFNCAIA
jgi:hypothetical protein